MSRAISRLRPVVVAPPSRYPLMGRARATIMQTNASMAKGLGHYSTTSAWDGNVGVCGHNRGAKYVIGDIKELEIGDTITYTTIYGTRTYEVVLVKTISSTDWSYLQATADNRITITTCLANQPSKRVCVQAVEVDR